MTGEEAIGNSIAESLSDLSSTMADVYAALDVMGDTLGRIAAVLEEMKEKKHV